MLIHSIAPFLIFCQALIHGLNRHYYSISINYRKNELEQKMLLNLHKKKWTDGLTLENFENHEQNNTKLTEVKKFRIFFLSNFRN
jgi:hypothetical protein